MHNNTSIGNINSLIKELDLSIRLSTLTYKEKIEIFKKIQNIQSGLETNGSEINLSKIKLSSQLLAKIRQNISYTYSS
jgi:hypothetical protein